METQTALKATRQGKMTPLEAVGLLDQEIGGITGAIWNPGVGSYKILNHSQIIKLPTRGAGRKEMTRMQELAVLAYWQARKNKSLRPGEIHLGKGCSTKHYKQGFEDYLEGLLQSYQN